LSRREAEVLPLLAEGYTNAEIGRELFISEETVRTHVRSLLWAMQARTRAHAVHLGHVHGLLCCGGGHPSRNGAVPQARGGARPGEQHRVVRRECRPGLR
jgi:DNA-binding CsgD family transcriptional regulator